MKEIENYSEKLREYERDIKHYRRCQKESWEDAKYLGITTAILAAGTGLVDTLMDPSVARGIMTFVGGASTVISGAFTLGFAGGAVNSGSRKGRAEKKHKKLENKLNKTK